MLPGSSIGQRLVLTSFGESHGRSIGAVLDGCPAGLEIDEKEDGLILKSSNNLTGAKLDSENDHRLFMAFCIAGTYIGNCTVTDSESVQVSYPNFIQEMNRLGAKIEIV